tara:strand:- start:8430 stop:9068 length:639 start_codon:yes stop_codon:yes gene_type:complete
MKIDSCVIVCRGSSVARIDELSKSYDVCLLVNEWTTELEKFDNISEFLLLQNKVIHVINRDARSFLKKEQYQKYKIDHCQLNVREPEYKQSPLRMWLEDKSINTKFLSESLVPISKTGAGGFPSTGVLAVAHAAKVLNAKSIDVIGLDFFEADYFSHHSHSRKPAAQDYQKKKGVVMKEYTEKLLALFPNTDFRFFTNSTFEPNLENVKIVK